MYAILFGKYPEIWINLLWISSVTIKLRIQKQINLRNKGQKFFLDKNKKIPNTLSKAIEDINKKIPMLFTVLMED